MEWVKAIHVMAVISWMAGLLYLFRLYVYHAMETEKVVMDRFEVMERRLLNAITHPAMVVSVATGLTMLLFNPGGLTYYFNQPWMHLKLTAAVLLIGTHVVAAHYRKALLKDPHVKPHTFYRVMNEMPTLLMIIIVVAVIVRPWAR